MSLVVRGDDFVFVHNVPGYKPTMQPPPPRREENDKMTKAIGYVTIALKILLKLPNKWVFPV